MSSPTTKQARRTLTSRALVQPPDNPPSVRHTTGARPETVTTSGGTRPTFLVHLTPHADAPASRAFSVTISETDDPHAVVNGERRIAASVMDVVAELLVELVREDGEGSDGRDVVERDAA